MNKSTTACFAAWMMLAAAPATAWGDLGHEVTALIAYRHLTPAAKAKVDAMLAADTDPLTAADFASRATWADKYRNLHRETAKWHFVDLEIDHPDLVSACFGMPPLAAGQPASAGSARDCIVNKIAEFEAELKDASTPPAERLMALKFLMHFVGDLHQPLHASDHNDRGGNCVRLSPSPDGHDTNLHAYWDNGTVESLGDSASTIAAALDAQISPGDIAAWARGGVGAWTMESFSLSRKDVYALASRPACGEHRAVALTQEYQATARKDAALQLEKAGVRLAVLLNRALGSP
jgi:S1/P1 Nuclease